MTARYDGQADWYDTFNTPGAEANRVQVRRLLGSGTGRCLDLGCGTGQYVGQLREAGWTVVGLDRSTDQLRVARERLSEPLVLADASVLPFADGSFDAVIALWISTDVDDFAGVVSEAARVLAPGGVFAFYGVHPCFNGPHVELREDGATVVHPTYRMAGWHAEAPYWKPGGVRSRVGMRHVPLAEFFGAFLAAGLTIEQVVEARPEDPVPHALGIRSRAA